MEILITIKAEQEAVLTWLAAKNERTVEEEALALVTDRLDQHAPVWQQALKAELARKIARAQDAGVAEKLAEVIAAVDHLEEQEKQVKEGPAVEGEGAKAIK